ncbi:hypothetical protein TNCV_3324121 [Trichonephila clavipes]|nr:hypothetical protein TNCV_3324121 [Trichonephila clavipes]
MKFSHINCSNRNLLLNNSNYDIALVSECLRAHYKLTRELWVTAHVILNHIRQAPHFQTTTLLDIESQQIKHASGPLDGGSSMALESNSCVAYRPRVRIVDHWVLTATSFSSKFLGYVSSEKYKKYLHY